VNHDTTVALHIKNALVSNPETTQLLSIKKKCIHYLIITFLHQ